MNFQEFVEPLLDIETLDLQGDTLCKNKIEKDFTIFSSHFNKTFGIPVKPFPLTHRLSYFATYTDIDTYNHLKPENYEKIKQLFEKYVHRVDVEKFLGTLISSYPKVLTELRDKVALWYEAQRSMSHSKSLADGKPLFDRNSKELDITTSLRETPKDVKNESLLLKSNENEKNGSLLILDSKEPKKESQNFSYLSHLVHVLGNRLFDMGKEIKIKREKLQEINNLFKKVNRKPEDSGGATTTINEKVKDSLSAKEKKKKIDEKEKIKKDLEVMYKQKYETAQCYREVCFYYFNSIRLGLLTKFNDTASYIGFLLIRNPEHRFDKLTLAENKTEITAKVKTHDVQSE